MAGVEPPVLTGGHVIVVMALAFEAQIAAGPELRVIRRGKDLVADGSRAITRACRSFIGPGVVRARQKVG